MISSRVEIRSEVVSSPASSLRAKKHSLGPCMLNSALARSEDFMNLRIAVVDDSVDMLNKLISVLETEFDVVATATDGKSGLERIRSCCPDVVVLDLEMPLLNGIEVTRELSKH